MVGLGSGWLILVQNVLACGWRLLAVDICFDEEPIRAAKHVGK
jgi:hypothetical protein